MSAWWNVDARGQRLKEQRGLNLRGRIIGEDAIALIDGMGMSIVNAYMCRLGRPPSEAELRLLTARLVERQSPKWFPRNPESEIL